MSKRTNTMYFEDNTEVDFVELPEGYFYKDHFYTENKCFKVLLEEGLVRIHHFVNGTWECGNILFRTLEELYNLFEDEIAITYAELKEIWKDVGYIRHNPCACTLYSYEDDDEQRLFDSRGETLNELKFDKGIIESAEHREETYCKKLSKEECIAYLKKPIKERIKILEESL